MSGRHQPEEGADSQRGLDAMNGEDPPLVEIPRASRDFVTRHVRAVLGPQATQAQVMHEVSMVLMADALGRAIHAERKPGSLLDMNRCVRVNKDGLVEEVPYAYDDERPDGYRCECEAVALLLVNTIAQQDAEAPVIDIPDFVPPRPRPGLDN